MIRHLASRGEFCCIWAQDLHAAYRQYPVQDPSHCYVLVMTPSGPTLWRHRVMPFGATASVFHFNKMTDALLWLARSLLAVPAIHYVDDLGSVDPVRSALSSFECFDSFCSMLGYRLKFSKRQPPDKVQKIQGVILDICEDGVRVAPSEARVRRVSEAVRNSLLTDQLTPETASKLAGKLGFLSTSLWGRVGHALTRPLHGRAQAGSDGTSALNSGLRASLRCLLTVLETPLPRFLPFRQGHCVSAVLYADAFFQLGDVKWSVGAENIPTRWPSRMHLAQNGWGFLCRKGPNVTAGHGRVPANILQMFCSRRAYIYFLEIMAQAICLLTNHRHLSKFWVSFCDNRAGLAAISKGYGRDETINNLLSWFHALSTRMRWHGHFEWVSSSANLSDKISRGDLSIAATHGWDILSTELDELWPIIGRIARDPEFAIGEGVSAALAIEWHFQPRSA